MYCSQWLAKTRWTIPEAKEANDNNEHCCLWFRGLLPYSQGLGATAQDNLEPQIETVTVGDISGNLVLGTDGGSSTYHPIGSPLYRVFSAGVILKFDDTNHILGAGLVFSTAPGPTSQTVPRSELFAPIVTLQGLDLAATTKVSHWCSDASYVVNNSRKHDLTHPISLRKGPLSSRHGDLWTQLFQNFQIQ